MSAPLHDVPLGPHRGPEGRSRPGRLALVSIIDDQVFGDLKSFREQFSDLTQEQVFAALKRRLAPLLRRVCAHNLPGVSAIGRRASCANQSPPSWNA